MTKWVCTVCGYVYEGDAAPAECPVCHVGADKFKKVEGDLTLAAEHEYGVYAKTVKNNPEISDEDKKYIFDQLKANFEGECSEVGMYLCMARIAHREGYPEVGLYCCMFSLFVSSFLPVKTNFRIALAVGNTSHAKVHTNFRAFSFEVCF